MTSVTLDQLTESKIEGTGVFDKLMQAVEAHIHQEFGKNRIKGPEYSTVYLGALQSTLDQSIRFLLDKDDALLKAKQAELIDKQIEELTARIALIQQQTANALTENATMLKQQDKLDAEVALIGAQKLKTDEEILSLQEGQLKTAAETALLDQKKVTEEAQISGEGVDADSVIGKQKALYQAQSDGYEKDAQQKAVKQMLDTWNVRKTADPFGTVETPDTKLEPLYIGRAVTKLMEGIGVDMS